MRKRHRDLDVYSLDAAVAAYWRNREIWLRDLAKRLREEKERALPCVSE